MATTVDAIQAAIAEATEPGFRARLLARGQARSMIWRGVPYQLMRLHSCRNSPTIYSHTDTPCSATVQGKDRVVRLVTRKPMLGEPVGEPRGEPPYNSLIF